MTIKIFLLTKRVTFNVTDYSILLTLQTKSCKHWLLIVPIVDHAITICYQWSLIVLMLDRAETKCYHWSPVTLILDSAETTCYHWSPVTLILDRAETKCYHWSPVTLILDRAMTTVYHVTTAETTWYSTAVPLFTNTAVSAMNSIKLSYIKDSGLYIKYLSTPVLLI